MEKMIRTQTVTLTKPNTAYQIVCLHMLSGGALVSSRIRQLKTIIKGIS